MIFCTSNLAVEGVGDRLLNIRTTGLRGLLRNLPNAVDRVGYNNNIHTTVLAWVNDNDQLFADFRSYEDPEENQYIPHPDHLVGMVLQDDL